MTWGGEGVHSVMTWGGVHSVMTWGGRGTQRYDMGGEGYTAL